MKARKEVYLAQEAVPRSAEAALEPKELYFHYLEPSARKAAVTAASRGLCQVAVSVISCIASQVLVLEHLEGDVVAKSLAMKEGLEEAYGKGSFYMSLDKWECQRRSLSG